MRKFLMNILAGTVRVLHNRGYRNAADAADRLLLKLVPIVIAVVLLAGCESTPVPTVPPPINYDSLCQATHHHKG